MALRVASNTWMAMMWTMMTLMMLSTFLWLLSPLGRPLVWRLLLHGSWQPRGETAEIQLTSNCDTDRRAQILSPSAHTRTHALKADCWHATLSHIFMAVMYNNAMNPLTKDSFFSPSLPLLRCVWCLQLFSFQEWKWFWQTFSAKIVHHLFVCRCKGNLPDCFFSLRIFLIFHRARKTLEI